MFNADDESPDEPGLYTVTFSNVKTYLPIIAEWTGEVWQGPEIKTYKAINSGTMYWYQKQ